jgi:hypothetical protein
MSYYKFTENDLFVNFLDTKPSCKFDIYNSQIFYNNTGDIAGEFASSVPNVPAGHINLYELNVDRTSAGTGLIFPFMTKDSSLTTFKTISTSDFFSTDYGTDIVSTTYPLSASITRELFESNHFATMRTANETAINNERTGTGRGVALSLQTNNLTGDGLPDYSTTDGGVASLSSLDRYDALKPLISKSRINSLKNIINSKSMMSPHFRYSTTFSNGYSRDLDAHTVNLISIPSIFYGSKIERGTINLKYYITGTLIGELRDENHNGELIHVGPAGSNGSGSVAGIALYEEGFLVLTGSWSLKLAGDGDQDADYLNQDADEASTWYYWGVGANDGIPTDGPDTADSKSRASASFSLEFSGSNTVPVVTMMAHAPKGHLNYSNNPTYLSHSATAGHYTSVTSSVTYGESNLSVVNVVSSSYDNPTGSFAKETYISKIGLYDKEKNLIGVTTVAKPVKKTEDREFTFKIKMDI